MERELRGFMQREDTYTLRIYAKVKDKDSKREVSDTMRGLIQLKDFPKQP